MRVSNRVRIVRGEDFSRTFKFRTNNGVDSVDFTNATEIKFVFKEEDNTFLTVSSSDAARVAVSGSAVLGNVVVDLTAAQTATLRKGLSQNIEVAWEIAGEWKMLILEKCLDILDPEGLN